MEIDEIILNGSLNARGQINHEIVFYIVHGEQRKRAYAIPTNTDTPQRRSIRGFWRNGMEYWQNKNQTFKNEYNLRAKKYYPKMQGYNLFMRDWMREVYALNIIKSIQHKSVIANNGNNDYGINAVAEEKTVVKVCCFSNQFGDDYTYIGAILSGTLTSTTNVRVRAYKGANCPTIRAMFEVIEYY